MHLIGGTQDKMNIVKIDLNAISYNIRLIKNILPKKVGIMGIVKSDAYGHGIIEVSRILYNEGIKLLGVAYPSEAYKLIKNNIRASIVILCGFQKKDEAEMIIEYDVIPVIWDLDMIHMLNNEAKKRNKKIKALLKIDTGMGRLGIPYNKTKKIIKALYSMNMIEIKGLLSHFSCADILCDNFTQLQIKRFKETIHMCNNIGISLSMNSLANSAGIINYQDSLFDIVRPGIILYGGLPNPNFKVPFKLKQAMEFKGKVLQIREVPPNTPLSYGKTYITKSHKKIAIVSGGYGNGIPRAISNKGYVLIRGRKAPIIGQICMDLITCDITHINDVIIGDNVIFMGTSEKEKITADDISKWAGTISYEIFCSIGKINKREYIK